MIYFTKIVVCLKVILTEIVECETILYHLWYYWNVSCHWAHCRWSQKGIYHCGFTACWNMLLCVMMSWTLWLWCKVLSLLKLQNKASLEWHHIISSKKKKARTMPSADKIISTIIWDTGDSWWPIFCPEGEPSVLLTLFRFSRNWDVPFMKSAKWIDWSYLNMIMYDILLHVCLGQMGSIIFKFSAVIPTIQLDPFRTWKNTKGPAVRQHDCPGSLVIYGYIMHKWAPTTAQYSNLWIVMRIFWKNDRTSPVTSKS